MNYVLSGLSRTAPLAVFATLTMTLFLSTLANAKEQPGAVDAMEQAPASAGPATAVPDSDSSWHTAFTMYLWFPGVHGTSGAGSRSVDFRASAGDLLSNFRFGLMGALNVQRGRFVILGDLMWVRLRATNTTMLPFSNLPQLSAEVKADEFILNPEVGYRFFDREKVKIDALTGIRYWYLGSSLQFTPSPLGFNFSGSKNFVDPLMGARMQLPLSPKMLVTIRGDVGGWGAGSELDYQIVGALGFKVSPRFTLGVGYRYLYVNYRPTNFIFDTAMSGPLAGLTYTFK